MKVKIKLNKDAAIVENVRRKLMANDGYCPCKLEHLPENKCMCQEFRNMPEGECHCGLYVKTIIKDDD